MKLFLLQSFHLVLRSNFKAKKADFRWEYSIFEKVLRKFTLTTKDFSL